MADRVLVLLGPIAGIMLCDYYVVRRTRLEMWTPLYDGAGEYARRQRVQLAGDCGAGGGGGAEPAGVLNAATGKKLFPQEFDVVYGYAWFVGLGVGFVVYWGLMQGVHHGAHRGTQREE